VSAISPENFEKYIAVYNAGIVPCVPEQGSLGASGDLGPLAHIALVVTGAWRAKYEGEVLSGEEVLQRAGLEPARLSYKEGLAMINGTSMMVGVAVPVIYHAKKFLKQSSLIAALTLEALRGKIMPYHPAVHRNKPHPGQIKVADAIWTTLGDSKMVVQDEEVDSRSRMRTRCAPVRRFWGPLWMRCGRQTAPCRSRSIPRTTIPWSSSRKAMHSTTHIFMASMSARRWITFPSR
jgi:histidine ammonia-lyase